MAKKKPVIIIDASKREIREGTVETLKDMQTIVGGLIQRALTLSYGAELYVDEEGLLKPNQFGFYVKGNPDPFSGSGYIIGRGVGTKLTAENVKDLIRFVEFDEV